MKYCNLYDDIKFGNFLIKALYFNNIVSYYVLISHKAKVEGSSLFRRFSGKSAQDKHTKKVYCLLTQRVSMIKYICFCIHFIVFF